MKQLLKACLRYSRKAFSSCFMESRRSTKTRGSTKRFVGLRIHRGSSCYLIPRFQIRQRAFRDGELPFHLVADGARRRRPLIDDAEVDVRGLMVVGVGG